MRPVYFNNIEFNEIMKKVKELVKESENLPDEGVREYTASLLKYFDLLHREPFFRIMDTIEKNYPELEVILNKDYTISTLLELYDYKKEKPENFKNGKNTK